MNTRAKGRRIENRARKELEADGWLVYQVPGTTKWNKEVDIFGLFDLFAMHEIYGMKLIQIKTNRKPSLKRYHDFVLKYARKLYVMSFGCGEYLMSPSVEIWVWYDRKEWKKIMI